MIVFFPHYLQVFGDVHFITPGAAFVRLANRSEALQAITGLHQSQTMPVSVVEGGRAMPVDSNSACGYGRIGGGY